MAQRRVSIADVADHAGVSIATVSRAVNGRYGVSPKTIALVQEAIDSLGYESSLVARSLRNQRTNVIGILVSGIEPFSAELLKGASRALQDTGYELIVYSGGMSGNEGWERQYLSRLNGTLTDGIILCTPTVVEINSTHPVVAVDPHVSGSQVPVVDAENYEGARLATQHLIELGHTRIGHLAGRHDLLSAQRREQGFRAALAEAGLTVDESLILQTGFTMETTEQPALEMLSHAEPPTAVFAANDLAAIQLVHTAASLEMSVPDDLSVVGFDNIPDSALVDPPLTTVDQSIQHLGETAVETLIGLIERESGLDESDPIHITVPTKLVVRRSTARRP